MGAGSVKKSLSFGFPPISTDQARVLILGSMPGLRSLEAGEYYAHPRNAFWEILGHLFHMKAETYAERIHLIKANHLALWDVLECCRRKGSLDAKIADSSIAVNDFVSFLSNHPRITHVFFNGAKAEREFIKRVRPCLPEHFAHLRCHRLPSTSPAMAGLRLSEKRKAWKKITAALEAE